MALAHPNLWLTTLNSVASSQPQMLGSMNMQTTFRTTLKSLTPCKCGCSACRAAKPMPNYAHSCILRVTVSLCVIIVVQRSGYSRRLSHVGHPGKAEGPRRWRLAALPKSANITCTSTPRTAFLMVISAFVYICTSCPSFVSLLFWLLVLSHCDVKSSNFPKLFGNFRKDASM